jgi:NodT family efflux transporter outer membrane factor (OMF) lipoprotein
MKVQYVLIAIMGVGLCGCKAVGPDYKRPQVPVPSKFSETDVNKPAELRPADVARWWMRFNDPLLNSLIEEAAAANLDLKVAEARIAEARAVRGLTTADKYPTVNTSASYTRERFSPNGIFPIQPPELSDYRGGFDASWEPDVFGRVRRQVQAADADIQTAQENKRAVLVSLLAEVARNYIAVRSYQDRIAITNSNIKTQHDSMEITQARYNSGLTSELNVLQAKAQLATTQSALPTLQTGLSTAIHRLGVLMGRDPGALKPELFKGGPIPMTEPNVPVGLPSELLRRRPDVQAAEHRLEAATARIGVATADLYPRFSLTGSFGLESTRQQDVFNSGSQFWSFGPGLSWPLFDAGRIRANIRVHNAQQQEALALYEKTVLTSLEDVENALVAYGKEQEKRVSLKEAVAANERAMEIANDLYIKGLVDFLNVLDAQRTLYTSQDELSQSQATVATDLATLYKTLGGGY